MVQTMPGTAPEGSGLKSFGDVRAKQCTGQQEMAGPAAGHFNSNLQFPQEDQRPWSWKSSWLGMLTVLLRMSLPGTLADA